MPATLHVLPAGLALPAPWGLFEVLLLATFAAHLLVMNVVLGGTFLALCSPGPNRDASRTLARHLPTAVAITVNLGIPPLLFASVLYGQYLYTAAILSASAWVAFFMLVMVAYALLYWWQSRAGTPGTNGSALAAGGLLLAASFVMTNVATLSVRPDIWHGVDNHLAGLWLNVADPTFWPRWLHFVLASLAVAGLFLAMLKSRAARRGDASARETVRLGMRWFFRATLAQLVVGTWFLIALPEGVRHLFVYGNVGHTVTLACGLGLAALALMAAFRGKAGLATLYLTGAVCVMVVVRELVRRAYLAPEALPESLPVAGQYGPFIMFCASVVAVAALVIWLLLVLRRASGQGEA